MPLVKIWPNRRPQHIVCRCRMGVWHARVPIIYWMLWWKYCRCVRVKLVKINQSRKRDANRKPALIIYIFSLRLWLLVLRAGSSLFLKHSRISMNQYIYGSKEIATSNYLYKGICVQWLYPTSPKRSGTDLKTRILSLFIATKDYFICFGLCIPYSVKQTANKIR